MPSAKNILRAAVQVVVTATFAILVRRYVGVELAWTIFAAGCFVLLWLHELHTPIGLRLVALGRAYPLLTAVIIIVIVSTTTLAVLMPRFHVAQPSPRFVPTIENWAAKQPQNQPQKPAPSLLLNLALITVIHKIRDPDTHRYMNGGQNDLDGVLLACQTSGASVKHINRLLIAGDVPAGFDSYLSAFSKGDGTESQTDLEDQYSKLKPFFRISWISYPLAPNRIDPTDEEFMKFKITESMGATETALPPGGSEKDYFGFEATRRSPKYLLTSPVWYLLVEFSKTANDYTGIYPRLRSEVKSGRIKLRADVDGELVDIPPQHLTFPWAVSLAPETFEKEPPQDLFNGIDRGSRNTMPTGRDPLMRSPCTH